MMMDLKGVMPESWCCVDCGINTAPGFKNRAQAEQAFAVDWSNQGFMQKVNEFTEVYTVKAKVWQAAGMDPMGGCLCIGCLDKRIGRLLVARDFVRKHPFNSPALPATERLLARRAKCGP